MTFNEVEQRYLAQVPRGRLATVAPDGGPQNKPVGFEVDAEHGTIDIHGFGMAGSAKFRNVGRNPAVSFVVDDAVGEGAANMRFLEIRGRAEQVRDGAREDWFIRIRPRRLLAFNIDPERPGMYARDVEAGR